MGQRVVPLCEEECVLCSHRVACWVTGGPALSLPVLFHKAIEHRAECYRLCLNVALFISPFSFPSFHFSVFCLCYYVYTDVDFFLCV